MSDRSLTPVSGPGDLGLALAQPESRAVSTAEQAQIFDQVATATAAVLSDVVTSPLQTPAPFAPSPVPSVCGTETTDSVDGDDVDATVLYDVEMLLTQSSTVQTVTATTTIVHTTSGQNVSFPVPPQAYTTAATAAVQAGQPVPNPPILGPVQTCSPQYTGIPRSAIPHANTSETGMRLRSGHTLPPRPVPAQVNRPTAKQQVNATAPDPSNPTQSVIQNVPLTSVMPQILPAQSQTQVPPTPQSIAQAFPPAVNPYQLPQPLSHEHNVARPSPVAGLSQVFQDLAQTWATTRDSHQVGYQPPVTGTTAPWIGVEREWTDLKGQSEPELAHLLNGLDGARAAPAMPAARRGSQTGRSRASTRASSRISMTSTQFRDAIDEALRVREGEMTTQAEERERRLLQAGKRERRLLQEQAAQAEERELLQEQAAQAEERERRLLQEQAKQTLEMKREMAAQAKQMERLVKGAAREAATKATKDTAKSFKEQQEKSEVARRHHQVFTSPPVPCPPNSCHDGPRSRSLENVPRALAQNDHITMTTRPGTARSDQCPLSPVSSACPTSGQGTATTIVPKRPVSPAISSVTVSTDTDHQLPIRSAHDCTAQGAQPLRTQAAVYELPPAQTPVATQPHPPACIAMPPMPTTRANAPLPQALRKPAVRCTPT